MANKKTWSANDIMNWQSKTFPRSTVEGQIEKFCEEFNEVAEAFANDAPATVVAGELADMFIVACGILRLDAVAGAKAFSDLLNVQCALEVSDRRLNNAINRKMEVNVARKWRYRDGLYKHA